MDSLQKKILTLENKVIEQKRLNKRFNSALNERFELIKKRDKQEKLLESEIKDVEKLKGFTFENFVYTLFLSKERKLRKEEQEAMVAKLQYDEYVKAVEELTMEIETMEDKLKDYEKVTREYLEVVKTKEKKILLQGTKISDRLSNTNNRIAELKNQDREIKEAYIAGEDLRFALKKSEVLLEKTENLGIIHIRNAGVVDEKTDFDFDEILESLYKIQRYLRKYHRELNDIADEFSKDIDIDDFLKFVNYWLEGLFEEMIANKKIEAMLTRVAGTKWDVIDLNRNLHKKRIRIEEELSELIKEREMILGYKQII